MRQNWAKQLAVSFLSYLNWLTFAHTVLQTRRLDVDWRNLDQVFLVPNGASFILREVEYQ